MGNMPASLLNTAQKQMRLGNQNDMPSYQQAHAQVLRFFSMQGTSPCKGRLARLAAPCASSAPFLLTSACGTCLQFECRSQAFRSG